MATAHWIAVDWGTSRLRLWALDGMGRVVGDAASDRGMGRLQPDDFEGALLELAAPFLAEGGRTKVLICGMAGARQGWIEAPYSAVPCLPAKGRTVRAPTRDPRLDVRILPGLCQMDPPDVMRGEETQIAGILARDPGFDGTLCLPGTHSKWVRIAGGTVQSFNTAMTGELFDLLCHQSILRHSLDASWDDAVFAAAIATSEAQPAQVFSQLFGLRAGSLVGAGAQDASQAHLSGLLIGAELAAMRNYWQGRAVAVIGADNLARCYHSALAQLGGEVTTMNGVDLALEGLKAAYRQQEDCP
ncbi:2-dehydro-3-deoxygalactonokinase [Pseudophaeobacter flagellatus]|uniref:2-dehydro-3-deoxygalactonokinase n=1 Tax=Pseudophaeobacter flagellatus TaxID=2899119 RepID=UPI001E61E366|nr:2-dehydro-3-deoxygalactonokinase [Pseudophaeobacter flagellatus]MCD9147421.1 2-dehydro-3-deoxygalactonokinase [Pseudophaeobacter flagellatus]